MSRASNTESLPPLFDASEEKRSNWTKVLLFIAGVLTILIGIVAWILPFLPGVPLVVGGLALMGLSSRVVRNAINRLDCSLPERIRLRLRPVFWKKSKNKKQRQDVHRKFFESIEELR
jgi:hypothetical protein